MPELTVRLEGADPVSPHRPLFSGRLASASTSSIAAAIGLVDVHVAGIEQVGIVRLHSGAASRPESRASRARMSISTSS